MTTAAPRALVSGGSVVAALGAGTMTAALLAGFFFETDEGPDLVGVRTLAIAGLSLLLLCGTLVAFVLMARTRPVRRRITLGLVLALSAYPTTFLLAAAALIVLNALGIFW